jgi:hypothetical protein
MRIILTMLILAGAIGSNVAQKKSTLLTSNKDDKRVWAQATSYLALHSPTKTTTR